MHYGECKVGNSSFCTVSFNVSFVAHPQQCSIDFRNSFVDLTTLTEKITLENLQC